MWLRIRRPASRGLQSALLAGLGVACLNASAVPMGAQVCQSAHHLPGLPDVEFSLLPPRPGESPLVGLSGKCLRASSVNRPRSQQRR